MASMRGRGIAGALTDLLLNSFTERARRTQSCALTELQAACRAGRNAQRPVARLPLEVLLDAFSYLGFVDLKHASHVCRYWRSAAVGCPSLWTRIQLQVSPDGSNIDSANYELRELVDRTDKMRLHLSLDIGVSSRRQQSARWDSTVLFNLAPLAQEREKLSVVDINLVRPSFVTGWNFVFDGPLPKLQHLNLRFAQASSYADFAQHPSIFACELPELQSLDISGVFEFPLRPWEHMPSLRALTLRKTTGSVDLSMVSQRIARPCTSLESVAIYSRHGYHISERARQTPLRHPALSLLCLRGNIGEDINSVLDFAGFLDIAEIAIHRPNAGGRDLAWIYRSFEATELDLLVPPGSGNVAGQHIVSWFTDKRARARAEILPLGPWALHESLAHAVSTLTIDEALLDTALNGRRLHLQVIQHLTIRIAHTCVRPKRRAGQPIRFQTAVYRGPAASPLWYCPALVRLDHHEIAKCMVWLYTSIPRVTNSHLKCHHSNCLPSKWPSTCKCNPSFTIPELRQHLPVIRRSRNRPPSCRLK